MKKITTTSIITVFALLLSSSVAFAQPTEVKEAIKDTEESTSELINAKDEESPFTLQQRLKAFKDVISLSMTEAKDMKVKLLSVDLEGFSEDIKEWRENKVKQINEIISHYEKEKEFLNENEDSINEEEIISKAKEFKQWRKDNYIPLNNKVQTFILMNQEENIINTANNRWSKIKKDISILKDAGIEGISELEEMLSKSRDLIEESERQNKEAMELFVKSIKEKEKENATSTEINASTTTATSTATSSESSSTQQVSMLSVSSSDSTTSTEMESSTTAHATGTKELSESTTTIKLETASTSSDAISTTTPDSLDSSIKDLVGASLDNVRVSYQVFIEMSNFVRELLE